MDRSGEKPYANYYYKGHLKIVNDFLEKDSTFKNEGRKDAAFHPAGSSRLGIT